MGFLLKLSKKNWCFSMEEPQVSDKSISRDFIRRIIDEDVQNKRYNKIVTRFPPEPNGFLHIGHAKSICLNFGIAEEFKGACHLRFDDTDPTKEDTRYENSIQEDIRWLGFDWAPNLFNASDYFDEMYEYAVGLIKAKKAYVCGLTEEEIREYRGTVTTPGRISPFAKQSVEENLSLFERMKAGEFPDGSYVLRARIDMASPNMKMRDPLLYRIRHAHHYKTGDKWCLYPMYDYAHPISDAIEGITHSICTLEFENNRELYDWVLNNIDSKFPYKPHQYEFARLDLQYTVMSKRKLLQLVENKHVSGWDDPRLPTIAGLRRRGCTPEAIKQFCEMVGIAKANSSVEMSQLDFCLRDDLNSKAPRVLAVLRPLKVIIDNYPEDQVEELEASYWPHDIPKTGSRIVPFTKELYIEQDDFLENPPKDFFRLAPGREVRLRYGYCITCTHVDKNDAGEIIAVHCTYDPETKSGGSPIGRKVKGTIHWVSSKAIKGEVRLYDRLLSEPHLGTDKDFLSYINPKSLEVLPNCRLEPSLEKAVPGDRFQFERQGYFFVDPIDSKPGHPVFNRIVTLKDSWAKKQTA
ncbi:Glutaminyl-tRNA synthetase [Criblamydia sequanensis CRIB-18]|uniref:Glutamine--tRNA ligase n=2 Tax=Candidatus Criblamydia sequanensis TaxID=340071 RepID=A0A090E0Z4_9BACT|nr:Glutaminyl-tRNA synthetase [Criblamydia sequanensis CRIB-18]